LSILDLLQHAAKDFQTLELLITQSLPFSLAALDLGVDDQNSADLESFKPLMLVAPSVLQTISLTEVEWENPNLGNIKDTRNQGV